MRAGGVFRGYDGRLLVAVSVGWFGIRLGREAIPPLLPVIIDAVEITPSTAGVGLTVMWAIYALAQYPGGRLSDGLSRKTVLVGSLGTVLFGFGVLSLVSTYAGLLVGFALAGLGAGAYFAPSRATLADLFTGRRGQAFGIISAAGSIGAASAAGVAALAVAVGPWQSAFVPVLVAVAGVLVAIHVWQREAYVLEPVTLDVGTTVGRLFDLPDVRGLLVAYMLVSFSWQGFLGFLPTFLQAERGFSPVLSSGTYALVFVTAIVVGPSAGRLGDAVPRLLVAIVGLGVAMVGLAGVLLGPRPVGVVLGVFLVAAGMRAYPPVMQSHLVDLFPDESMAGDLGSIKTVWTGFGSLAPTYVGVVAARATYGLAFGGFVVCLLVGASVLAYLHAAGRG